MTAPRPAPLVAFYGDDFTGSSDALLVFSLAGVSTVLFLAPPSAQLLARFPEAQCIGVAGMSRAQSPEWMERELPPIFQALKAWGAPLLYYKVCSTFDSAPEVGSIGKAIDIGSAIMGNTWSPIIVGAPTLRRYQAFGNLFAAAGQEVYRIDRHPTMARHPVTPMGEADLRKHLAAQTARRIGLIDLMQLQAGQGEAAREALRASDNPAVFIDVVDQTTQAQAGALVWESRANGLFTASSSGLPAALSAHWQECGMLKAPKPQFHSGALSREDIVAVASGSCSPITAAQIRWAMRNGFAAERLDIQAVCTPEGFALETEKQINAGLCAIAQGRSPLVYSACGPDDSAVLEFDAIAQRAGLTRRTAARRVGEALASIMCGWLDRSEVRRAVVAGGDSSGEVASALGIDALTIAAPIEAGAPLCCAWSDNPRRQGLEIVMKGGQMGSEEFFGVVKGGQ